MTNRERQKVLIKRNGWKNTSNYCQHCENNESICIGNTVAAYDNGQPCATAYNRMYKQRSKYEKNKHTN